MSVISDKQRVIEPEFPASASYYYTPKREKFIEGRKEEKRRESVAMKERGGKREKSIIMIIREKIMKGLNIKQK